MANLKKRTPFRVRSFNRGQFSDFEQTIVPEGAATELENVLIDEVGRVKQRGGLKLRGESPTSLISHWTFDNSTSVDDVGSNDGTDTDVTYVDGKFGKAASFNGTSSKIAVSADTTIDANSVGTFGFSAYIFVDSDGESNVGRIVDKWSGTKVGYRFYVHTESSSTVKLTFEVGYGTTNSIVTTSTTLSTGAFHRVEAVHQSDKSSDIYIDGTKASYGTDTTGNGTVGDDSAVDLTIGNETAASAKTFDGEIDDVRFYNAARTDAQIAIGKVLGLHRFRVPGTIDRVYRVIGGSLQRLDDDFLNWTDINTGFTADKETNFVTGRTSDGLYNMFVFNGTDNVHVVNTSENILTFIGAVTFNDSGLDDLTIGGTYTGTAELNYKVEIDQVDAAKTVDTIVQPGGALNNGTHTAITTTKAGGSGDDNLTVDVVIAAGAITTVTVNVGGNSYAVDDTITLTGLAAGGGGGDDAGTVDIASIIDTFRWSDDGGSTWDVEKIEIDTTAQSMNNGITATFAASSGHTVADDWTFTAYPDEGNENTSAPRSQQAEWHDNRMFVINSVGDTNFSDVLDGKTYARSTNIFRSKTPAKKLKSFKEKELIIYSTKGVQVLSTSGSTPLTDWALTIINEDVEFNSPRSVVNVGNDQIFLAKDGVRVLSRTAFDKIQSGLISQPIQDIIRSINQDAIDKACAWFVNNRYILAIPTGSNTENDTVLIWDSLAANIAGTLQSGWTVIPSGVWTPAVFAEMEFSDGNIDLVMGDNRALSLVYQALNLSTDNGETIVSVVTGIDHTIDNARDGIWDPVQTTAHSNTSSTIEVFVEVDRKGFNSIGTIDISANVPTLPIALPFILGSSARARKLFRSKLIGRGRTCRVKMKHNTYNQSPVYVEYTLWVRPLQVRF